jgi:hypothetical protein
MTAAQRSPRSGGRLSSRSAAWTAWSLWAVVVVLTVLAMVLVVVTRSVLHDPNDQWQLVWLRMSQDLAFATVGLIIASRRPANPIGWLLLFFGLSLSANEFLRAYADYTLFYRPGTLPAGLAIAWVATWIWAFIFPILPLCSCCSPTVGCRLAVGVPSPGWLAWSMGCLRSWFRFGQASWSTFRRSPTRWASRR